MIILPAIDLKDGRCVRLRKGDFNTAEQVADDALETAAGFKAAGCSWLHTVDLDGAKSGAPVNHRLILELARQSGLHIETGGGIRDLDTISMYLENGVQRVILGSVAIKDPKLVEQAASRFGDRIAVGIDAKNGYAAAQGWLDDSDIYYIDLARRMEQAGVHTIIYTDIGRDGMLSGPNLEQLDQLNRAVSCDIIASGGVTDLDDIRALAKIGVYGAICGKSVYKGTLDLKQAVLEAQRV